MWGRLFFLWCVFVGLDWLFGVPLEWCTRLLVWIDGHRLVIVLVTAWLIMKMNSYKAETALGIIVVDWVVYFIIPRFVHLSRSSERIFSALMPRVASAFLYLAVLVWGGAVVSLKIPSNSMPYSPPFSDITFSLNSFCFRAGPPSLMSHFLFGVL